MSTNETLIGLTIDLNIYGILVYLWDVVNNAIKSHVFYVEWFKMIIITLLNYAVQLVLSEIEYRIQGHSKDT